MTANKRVELMGGWILRRLAVSSIALLGVQLRIQLPSEESVLESAK